MAGNVGDGSGEEGTASLESWMLKARAQSEAFTGIMRGAPGPEKKLELETKGDFVPKENAAPWGDSGGLGSGVVSWS